MPRLTLTLRLRAYIGGCVGVGKMTETANDATPKDSIRWKSRYMTEGFAQADRGKSLDSCRSVAKGMVNLQ